MEHKSLSEITIATPMGPRSVDSLLENAVYNAFTCVQGLDVGAALVVASAMLAAIRFHIAHCQCEGCRQAIEITRDLGQRLEERVSELVQESRAAGEAVSKVNAVGGDV
jgi:hypothetical protein